MRYARCSAAFGNPIVPAPHDPGICLEKRSAVRTSLSSNTVHLTSYNMDRHLRTVDGPMAARSQAVLAHLALDPARGVTPPTGHDAVSRIGQLVQDLLMNRGKVLRGEKLPPVAVGVSRREPHV
jgi:hypothetical protein